MERYESAVPQEIAAVETDAASSAYAVRTAVGNMDTSAIASKTSLTALGEEEARRKNKVF